ncbi:ectonucleoside triphosphate diphosphohydrolase 5-like [Lethenteron reissneri]|uniref:ectonucleoside triphosphate diphosphohydrolase 5-like n=1 Tax=Lethenteron reissneri TaxID=7753 RepID=UPI002AB6C06B|nr:ectonucleoside triphosphate diphosphohydrolase 5-like [Lethenteron reissneri]
MGRGTSLGGKEPELVEEVDRYRRDIVDEELGGSVTVQQFEDKAREVCGAPDDWAEQQPFLCLDLTYISTLLQHGFGFQPDSTLMLSKKVGGVETGWALGAAFRDLAEMQGEQ